MSERQLNNILYVEDDPNMRMLVEFTLEEAGFNIEVCEHWSEAVAIAQYFKPDLFLLDVVLPEKDGVETLMALREIDELEETPAIFLTVDVDLTFSRNQDHKGMEPYDILGKPVEIDSLGERIRGIWRDLITVPSL